MYYINMYLQKIIDNIERGNWNITICSDKNRHYSQIDYYLVLWYILLSIKMFCTYKYTTCV